MCVLLFLLPFFPLSFQTVKLTSPDYQGVDPEEAVKDFLLRIKNYETVYESMDAVRDK